MATKKEFEDAARRLPSNRSPREQALVDEAHRNGMTDIKNLDHEARKTERIYGR